MSVHAKVASVAATPCKQTTAVADCTLKNTERNMVWSQFRLLSLSNLKSSHATIHLCHPTHTRDATSLLTTAGEHLTGACLWERVFCVVSHYAFHDNIKGLIDLISLLAFLKLFCLCCLQSDEEPNAGFLSAYLLLYKCARDQLISFDRTQLCCKFLPFLHFPLSVKLLKIYKSPLLAVFRMIYLLLK